MTIEIPRPAPPLDRRAILQAVDEAANAFALGRPHPKDVLELAGRRFELVLPFGCHGSGPETAPLRYEWDTEERKLKISAVPQTWTTTEPVRSLVGAAETEAIEGFWIARPWIRDAACPQGSPAPGATPSPRHVALAQAFAKGGSRLLRRNGRPYQATRKLDEGQTPSPGGYRLTLAGRIVDDGRPPVLCRGDGPDQRPTCFVRMELDRVALGSENEQIAEWTS